MSKVIEMRRRRAEMLDEARLLADGELSEETRAKADGLIAQADQLEKDIQREERLQAMIASKMAPAHNKLGRGDNETGALAAYIRTGDRGGVAQWMGQDERGQMALTLTLPSPTEMRAVVDSTMNITTAADGQNLVPTGFVRDVVLRKNEIMLAERLGVRRIPGVGTTVNYPVEAADPEDFAATSEQADNHANVYERDAGNTGIKAFTLAKKTRKIELTEELLEDNDVNLMAYISDRIARQIAGTHNAMLLTEVAANGTALKTFASATAIAANEPDDLVYHSTLAYYLDDGGSIGWVMRPSTYGSIIKLSGNARLYSETPAGSGFQRSLLGYPVVYSNKAAATAASAKDVYFGNWYYVGYREAPELRLITDPYSVDGLVILKYSFRAVYGVLQAGAIGYGVHPSA